MAVLHRFAAGFAELFHRHRAEQELDAELREFLDSAIENKMRTGMSRESATRAARMELGSTTAVKDHVRDVGWENVLETTWVDVRYAARTLRRSSGFTVVAVLSLALGIGANTAIFSLINTLRLRSLPVSHPEQLVELLSRYPGEPRLSSFSWRQYEHFGVRPSMWLPAAMEPILQKPSRRMDGTLGVGMLGRLRPGITIEQALAEMRVLDRYRLEDFAKTRSAAFARDTIELEPAAAGFATSGYRQPGHGTPLLWR